MQTDGQCETSKGNLNTTKCWVQQRSCLNYVVTWTVPHILQAINAHAKKLSLQRLAQTPLNNLWPNVPPAAKLVYQSYFIAHNTEAGLGTSQKRIFDYCSKTEFENPSYRE